MNYHSFPLIVVKVFLALTGTWVICSLIRWTMILLRSSLSISGAERCKRLPYKSSYLTSTPSFTAVKLESEKTWNIEELILVEVSQIFHDLKWNKVSKVECNWSMCKLFCFYSTCVTWLSVALILLLAPSHYRYGRL